MHSPGWLLIKKDFEPQLTHIMEDNRRVVVAINTLRSPLRQPVTMLLVLSLLFDRTGRHVGENDQNISEQNLMLRNTEPQSSKVTGILFLIARASSLRGFPAAFGTWAQRGPDLAFKCRPLLARRLQKDGPATHTGETDTLHLLGT